MNNSNSNRENVPNDVRRKQVMPRLVEIRADTFVSFQKRVEAILGAETSAIMYEAGIAAGKNSAKAHLQIWKE